MSRKLILFAAASLSALSAGALTSTVQAEQIEEIIITADPLRRSDSGLASSVAVLRDDRLAQRRQSTLGETLSGIPGISSDTFGGGASRPVIRGQTAPRVKVMSDGVTLLDASDISPDHAVSGETLLLDGIEILRGPSALIYGGGAIGGAVNMVDRKIPTTVPETGFAGEAELRFGTADKERAGVAGVTIGAGAFALRLEGAKWHTKDYELPFYTPAGHEEDADHEHEHEHEHEAEGFDRLVGSFNKTQTATIGGSWIGSRGYMGLAYTEKRSDYGLPGHSHEYESCHPHGSSLHCGGHDHGGDDHDHEHDHGDENHVPVVDLLSKRIDVRGELREPFAGVEVVRLRGGFTDYHHDEVDLGEIITRFTNKGHDIRLEAQHKPIGGFRGVIGLQNTDNDFKATGTEAFIPESNTRNTALFVLEEYVWGDLRFEGALRQEWQKAKAVGRADTEHKPFSASASVSWAFHPGYSLAVSLGRSQRAPHVQELYARGVHLATNTYELGTATLDEETAKSAELSLKKTSGNTTFFVSAYRYEYDGYIYARTLDTYEDFRLIRYTQEDARFTGFEGQVRHAFTPGVSVTLFGDYVRAKLNSGENLPRIAPGRIGVRSDIYQGAWSGNVEYIRVARQKHASDYEVQTAGYDMVNATVAYDFGTGAFSNQVFVRGTNLLDELAINHTSFISTLAPLRGRNIVFGIRTRF
ncbi:MAG: TonB-dependent receptor [Asticcacaulis sp.]